MSRFLIDEMFPPTVAGLLRETYGHDAVMSGHTGRRWVDHWAADDTDW